MKSCIKWPLKFFSIALLLSTGLNFDKGFASSQTATERIHKDLEKRKKEKEEERKKEEEKRKKEEEKRKKEREKYRKNEEERKERTTKQLEMSKRELEDLRKKLGDLYNQVPEHIASQIKKLVGSIEGKKSTIISLHKRLDDIIRDLKRP